MQTAAAECPFTLNEDTVAVITGTSRGLGLGIVKHISETTDSKVIATAGNPQASKPLRTLSKEHSNRLTLLTLDTEDERSIQVCKPCRPRTTAMPALVT